ncbi:MAG TPA: pyrroline-5-carboxylate reductase [Solirubrobacteraceae bacterium]|nr:pyrroline-5-carboxylate reductase [Solirubrobacteraceae bacterium]
MQVGLIGAGNMARALARGWGDPVLCSDAGSGRAAALVEELGGEAFDSNLEVARRADVVVLCHKPAQLERVAAEIAGEAKAVVSVLGGVPWGKIQAAYPGVPTFRTMPNTPVEVRRGIVLLALPHRPAQLSGPPADLEADVIALFERVATVVRVDEDKFEAATAAMGVAPAYQALVAEAQIDAAVRHGLGAAIAAPLVTETMAGTAALLAERGYDTLAVRREVTSPGGSTARGLAALERGGLRAAFHDAADAVIGWSGK